MIEFNRELKTCDKKKKTQQEINFYARKLLYWNKIIIMHIKATVYKIQNI